MNPHRRVVLLDEIRGFCICCMVFYHAFYLFGSQLMWTPGTKLYLFFEPVHLVFASVFIIISGICTQFSRSVLRRGCILLALALAISWITIVLLPKLGYSSFQDRFGILHFLSVSMLIAGALQKPVQRISPIRGAGICIALYLLFWYITAKTHVRSPYLFPLGVPCESFYSADYFPLLPHVFLFGIGVFMGRTILQSPMPDWIYQPHIAFFSWIGRHTLPVYLLHVPIILLCIYLIERI